MRLRRTSLAFLVVVLGTVLLASCGSSPTATPTATVGPTSTPTPTVAPGVTPQPTATPTAVPTPSFDAASYFKGKTIKVLVGFAPGGGYDTFARLFAKYAPKYFPGNPAFVVQNLAGSGGQRVFEAMNGKTDGLTVSVVHPRFFKDELLGNAIPYLDLNTINILGTPSAVTQTMAYYTFKTVATSWQDALNKGLLLTDGQTAPGDTGGIGVAFVQLLGGPMKQISGYGGTSEIAAAMDRGEITGSSRGNYTDAPRLYPQWVTDQKIVPLFTWGAKPQDDPDFMQYMQQLGVTQLPPDVFQALQMAGITPTAGQKTVFNLTEAINNSLSRTFALPAGVPNDVVNFWVDAFKKVVQDPDFVNAAKAAGYTVSYGAPADIKSTLQNGKTTLASDPNLEKLFGELAGTQ